MKLTIIILFLSLMQVSATVYSQATKFTFDVENKQVVDVLREIEENSQFRFFYLREQVDVERKVSVKANNATVEQILDELFKENGVNYELMNDFLIVLKKGDATLGISGSSDSFGLQQQPAVSGTVTDESGEPLPGVTVVVKGTTQGTVTNADGDYSLSNIPEDATLQFSFVGMLTQEVKVSNQNIVDITMQVDAIGIEEVVAVGYGVQKKVNLTGAIGIAKGEVLENRPITNVLEGLQGTVAGLNITNASGQPGSNPKINIRGATSISGGSPLVLVDGTEMNLNLVNPDDIESISVLKDAASSAIYGARAAYGVILVTTKSGKRNMKTSVSYNGNYFVSQPTIIPDKADSYKFALYVNEMRSSRNLSLPFNEEHLNLLQSAVNEGDEGWTLKPTNDAYYQHFNTDWAELVFADVAPGQRHNISLSGGSEKVGYRVSVGYSGSDGIVKIGEDNSKRYNFSAKLDNDIAKWIKTNFQFNFSRNFSNVHNLPPGHGPSIFHTVWRAQPPLPPTYEQDGTEYPTFIRLNPVSTLELGGRNKANSVNVNAKAGLEMTFGDFKAISNFTYNPYFYERVRNNKAIESIIPWAAGVPKRIDAGPSYVQKYRRIDNYYAFDIYGQYDKIFADVHNFKITLGYNQEWKTISGVTAFNYDLISPDILSLSNSTGDPTVTDAYDQWALRSAFSRINYSFKNKYLLEINSRLDGSSRFKKEDRFGYFPSVSAGWRISEESFMNNINYLSNLKLRASYGSLGNQSTNVLYPISQYNSISQVRFIFNGSRPLGITPGNPLGDQRSWETVSTFDVGLDLNLFQKLDATFDVYKRKTSNMLVTGNALPGVYGAPAPQENAADLEVNGWEASLTWNERVNSDFKYNVGFNISDWQGEITKFDNPTKSLSKAYYEGKKIGEIWGYETLSLFQSEDEIASAADHSQLGAGNLIEPGDVHYADLNNDGVINGGENTVDESGDRKIIGNTTPRYSYSITGGIEWNNLDLSIFFQGVGKRDFWLNGPIVFGGVGGYGNVIVTDKLYENVWSDGTGEIPENKDAYYFRPSEGAVINRNTQIQTRYLQDASYLRLKNITLGYTLPETLNDKLGISKCRVYIAAENFLTFTKLNENFDPEVLVPNIQGQGATNTVYNSGQSGKAYPISKRLSVGIDLRF